VHVRSSVGFIFRCDPERHPPLSIPRSPVNHSLPDSLNQFQPAVNYPCAPHRYDSQVGGRWLYSWSCSSVTDPYPTRKRIYFVEEVLRGFQIRLTCSKDSGIVLSRLPALRNEFVSVYFFPLLATSLVWRMLELVCFSEWRK